MAKNWPKKERRKKKLHLPNRNIEGQKKLNERKSKLPKNTGQRLLFAGMKLELDVELRCVLIMQKFGDFPNRRYAISHWQRI